MTDKWTRRAVAVLVGLSVALLILLAVVIWQSNRARAAGAERSAQTLAQLEEVAADIDAQADTLAAHVRVLLDALDAEGYPFKETTTR